MKNNLNINELIKIETMPKLFEDLEVVGKWVDENLEKLNLENIVYDEEHKQEYKKVRAEINNISNVLETKRKEIKEKILEPYKTFETKYVEKVKNKLTNASNKLAQEIGEIENNQKKEKEANLRLFFDNYNEDYHMEELISFEDVGLNITLSASETSLKKQIIDFFEKVANDFKAIQSSNYREEVLIEYKHNGFNYAQAVNTINTKHKEIEQVSNQLDFKISVEEQEQKNIENVKEYIAKPIEIDNEIIEISFKVKGTKSQLRNLKQFLKEEGIDYE